VTISVDVAAAPGVLAQALQELPPVGWLLGAVSDDGAWMA